MQQLRQIPSLSDVSSDLDNLGLAVNVEVNRELAARYGITAATIDNALYDALGQRIVSTIFQQDRKSTRLNSSHLVISYAVFCLKKKKLHRLQHLHRRATAPLIHRHAPRSALASDALTGAGRAQWIRPARLPWIARLASGRCDAP